MILPLLAGCQTNFIRLRATSFNFMQYPEAANFIKNSFTVDINKLVFIYKCIQKRRAIWPKIPGNFIVMKMTNGAGAAPPQMAGSLGHPLKAM